MKRILLSIGICLCFFSQAQSQCFNDGNQYPPGAIELQSCFDTIETLQYAGEYNLTTGYVDGESYTFYNDGPGYFITITLELSPGSVLVSGFSPVTIIYSDSYGPLRMHVNTDDLCGTDDIYTTSSVEQVGCVLSVDCDHLVQNPGNTVALACGPNTITTNQLGGEYNVTTGYDNGLVYEFTSPFPNNYITLRKASDNSIITQGVSPIQINYENSFGNIEMHVSEIENCGPTTESTSSSVYEYGCLPSTDCLLQRYRFSVVKTV